MRAKPEMRAAAAVHLLEVIHKASIDVWLDGGWGVDALLGEQTRVHSDLDIIVRTTDVPALRDVFAALGFGIEPGGSPFNFVLGDRWGLRVDVHAITFEENGNGVFELGDGRQWAFPAAAFDGQGTLESRSVRCLSAEAQVRCHGQGYVPTEHDLGDMALLQRRFGVELPAQLRRSDSLNKPAAQSKLASPETGSGEDKMQEIVRVAGRGLRWSQPSAVRMEYELRSGEERVATLKFRSAWGTFATAESGDGCWTFKRVGFWQNKASIRACGSETDLAVFKNDTWGSGGTLEFPDGRRFRATTNSWRTHFTFQTEADEPLVHFNYGGVFRRAADVEITPLGSSNADLPLFVLLGWYLAIMLDADAGAAAAVIATS